MKKLVVLVALLLIMPSMCLSESSYERGVLIGGISFQLMESMKTNSLDPSISSFDLESAFSKMSDKQLDFLESLIVLEKQARADRGSSLKALTETAKQSDYALQNDEKYISIIDVQLCKDYKDNDSVAVTFEWAHTKSEPTTFAMCFAYGSVEAHQKVQLEKTLLPDLSDYQSAREKKAPNVLHDAVMTFALDDAQFPVTISISAGSLSRSNDPKIIVEFNLSENPIVSGKIK